MSGGLLWPLHVATTTLAGRSRSFAGWCTDIEPPFPKTRREHRACLIALAQNHAPGAQHHGRQPRPRNWPGHDSSSGRHSEPSSARRQPARLPAQTATASAHGMAAVIPCGPAATPSLLTSCSPISPTGSSRSTARPSGWWSGEDDDDSRSAFAAVRSGEGPRSAGLPACTTKDRFDVREFTRALGAAPVAIEANPAATPPSAKWCLSTVRELSSLTGILPLSVAADESGVRRCLGGFSGF